MCATGATISATTVAAAAVTTGRRLQDGGAPQLYVTRSNHLLASIAGKSIGEAVIDVRFAHYAHLCLDRARYVGGQSPHAGVGL